MKVTPVRPTGRHLAVRHGTSQGYPPGQGSKTQGRAVPWPRHRRRGRRGHPPRAYMKILELLHLPPYNCTARHMIGLTRDAVPEQRGPDPLPRPAGSALLHRDDVFDGDLEETIPSSRRKSEAPAYVNHRELMGNDPAQRGPNRPAPALPGAAAQGRRSISGRRPGAKSASLDDNRRPPAVPAVLVFVTLIAHAKFLAAKLPGQGVQGRRHRLRHADRWTGASGIDAVPQRSYPGPDQLRCSHTGVRRTVIRAVVVARSTTAPTSTSR